MNETPVSSDDKTWALMAWLLGFFFGFIPALIIFIVMREKSKFVGFHALQALFWHFLYIAVMVPIILIGFAVGFSSLVGFSQQHSGEPPVGVIVGFVVMLLFVVLLGFANLIVMIVMAVKASGGAWPELPLVGRWARRAVE
ncbi:MAG: DUF4870 domain-containing protein [Deltaproteobacteria bacterium]|nr:DUF4870 domain-containing protein [Deltaproteobacteria bacterium]